MKHHGQTTSDTTSMVNGAAAASLMRCSGEGELHYAAGDSAP